MKCNSLFLATLFTIASTSGALWCGGWFAPASARAQHPRPGDAHARNHESDAAWRWRQNLPNHWRACVLHR